MAAIFQLRRGSTGTKPTLHAGELYVDQTSENLIVGVNGSKEITLLKLNDINTGSLHLTGDIRLSGSIYLGNETADNISALGVFTTNLVPNPTNTIDLGTTSAKWRNVYATNISGAIAATNGVVSGSSQIIAALPSGLVSGSSQVIDILIPLNVFSASILAETASLEARAATLGIYTASVETRFTTLSTLTGSNSTRLTNLELKSSSVDTQLTTLSTITSSLETRMITLANVTSSIHSYTSSLKSAIALSGIDVTINGNLTVAGTTTQINSTTLAIGDNIIELNGTGVANAGLQVKDPTGASTLSGSLLWDSTLDYWKGGTLGNESKLLRAGGDNIISSSLQLTQLNQHTQSLNDFSASVTASLEKIYQTTSSLNLFSASVTASLVSINDTTASLNTSVVNINLITASLNTSVTNINTFTQSANIRLTELEIASGSAKTSINALNAYTNSLATRWDNLQTYTTSVNSRFTTLANYTGSVNQTTASLNSFTASVTASLILMTASIDDHETRIKYVEYHNGITDGNPLTPLNEFSASINTFTSSINTTIKTKLNADGVISGSSQINGANIITNNITIAGTSVSLGGSITVATMLGGTGVVSGSSQVLGGSGVVSGSYETTGRSIVSSSAQIVPLLPSGVVSGSSQIITENSITLATHTTGNYVASLVQGTGVTISNNSGENSTPTIAIGQAVGTSANVQFASIGVGTTASGTDGEIRATGDITAFYSSDIRLKENIIPIPNALEKVNQISGNTYDWKEGYDAFHSHKGNDVGVIAQEVEAILPQIVTNRDNGFKAVQYEKIIPLLIEAIKELSAKIDRLENK